METKEFNFKGFKTSGFLMIFSGNCSVSSGCLAVLAGYLGYNSQYYIIFVLVSIPVWIYKA